MKQILEIEETRTGFSLGNVIEVWIRDDGAFLSIENPWAGDSETGFGQTTTISLTADQARQIAKYLIDGLADK